MKPQLRFKEFTDEWEEKKLGDIADIKAGKDLDKSKLINIGYPVYGNALTNKGLMGYYDTYEIKDEAVTVTGRGDIGKAFYRKGKFNTVGRLISIISKENPYFLTYAINKIKILNETTGVPQLTALQLKKYKVQLPSLSEQQTIGKFFSLLDQRIEKQERKVALLEEEKKGYMQKLFKQELRFKDEQGKDYPVWEEKKLGEIAKIYDGMHSTPNYKNHGVPFLSVENISDLKTNKYISEEEYQNSFKNNKAEYGDIFMTRIGSIGVANINLNNEVAYYVSLALIKPQKINNWYLMHAIHSEQVQKDLWSKTLQVAFPQKINKGDINFIKIPFPSLKEQEKIANFLNLLDQRIEKEQEKLKLMKEEKQGLMQRMFV